MLCSRSAFVKLVCDRESLNNTYFKAIGPKSQTSTEYVGIRYIFITLTFAIMEINFRTIT